LNDLTEQYKHPSKALLEYRLPNNPNGEAVPIEIVFVGLLDAVSSLMEENKLISVVPLVAALKQNYGEENLAIPESVQRCVHFAAAHELRFYQRLDSLEKTRGVQYLYPGTSEDITGGAPPGELGARAELQRVVLRDMLNEAATYGVAIDRMEDMARFKPETFQRFTLAHPISDGQDTYKIWELIGAYRELVPYVARLNFVDHMKIFLRWMAVRYTSAEFRATVTDQFDILDKQHRAILQNRDNAQSSYDALRNQWPAADLRALAKAQDALDRATASESDSLRSAAMEKHRPSVGVWERIQTESSEMIRRESHAGAIRRSADAIRSNVPTGEQSWDADPELSAATVDAYVTSAISADQESLVQAWKTGMSGTNPLPPKVMALFDLLGKR
jgi:hypothetical protein